MEYKFVSHMEHKIFPYIYNGSAKATSKPFLFLAKAPLTYVDFG